MTETATTSSRRITRCAVCKIDLKGRFVFVDEEMEKLLGLNQFELFGKALVEFLGECDQEIIELITSKFNRYETFFESARISLRDCHDDPVSGLATFSLNFNAGNPVNYQVIFTPDSALAVQPPARVQVAVDAPPSMTSEAVPTAPEYDHNLLDGIGVGVIQISPMGLVAGVNSDAQRLIGGEGTGLSLPDVVQAWAGDACPDLVEKVTTIYELAGRDNDLGPHSVSVCRPDGQVSHLCAQRRFPGSEDVSGLVFLIPDAMPAATVNPPTGGGLLDRMLNQLHTSASAARNLWRKLSHGHYGRLGKDGDFHLLRLSEQMRKTDRIIQDIRQALTCVEAPAAIETVDLNLLLRRIEQGLPALFQKRKVTLRCSDMAKIVTDRSCLEFAVRAVFQKCLALAGDQRTELRVSSATGEKACRVNLALTDVFVAAKALKRAFDYQGADFSGMESLPAGVNLAVARHLLETHGGGIEAVSERGKGTTFTLWIPTKNQE
ncbi:MAG: PAS domain-containing protein [candidate division Zixibacteria bacterium]|nr:PAS domain-containing protein [candidate division Zixibacteria bacterium]